MRSFSQIYWTICSITLNYLFTEFINFSLNPKILTIKGSSELPVFGKLVEWISVSSRSTTKVKGLNPILCIFLHRFKNISFIDFLPSFITVFDGHFNSFHTITYSILRLKFLNSLYYLC